MGKKFTILSFVGGGIRGLMSVTILQRLYEHNPNIIKPDLIAGCSTGSIITSHLLFGTTPSELIEFFTTKEIQFYNNIKSDPSRPAYSIDEVHASQAALHSTTEVDGVEVTLRGTTKIDSDTLRQKVLFVSFNVGGVAERDGIMVPKPWEPLMYTNMIPGHGDVSIAEASTSSGAMPGQLGSFKGNVDGAFFNHDPTIAAIALAVKSGQKLEDIVAITIGTGLMHDWIPRDPTAIVPIPSDTDEWGSNQWMNGVPNPFNNTPPFLTNQTGSSPMLDMCLNGTSTELMPMLARMLLGKDRYANINPKLPCFIPENSINSQAIALLQRKGAEADIEHAKELLHNFWPDPVAQASASGAQG